MTVKREDLDNDYTRERLFAIENCAVKDLVTGPVDVLWLLELSNVQHTEIENLRKLVAELKEFGTEQGADWGLFYEDWEERKLGPLIQLMEEVDDG